MERQVMQEFIEIYHSEQSLWKVRSSHYNNKTIKSMAYSRLVAKLQELYPNADIELVKRKINALRTNYRKELRKVEASRERNRLTGEPIYVPSLWYYELFQFIGDQENEDIIEVSDGSGVFDVQDVLRVDFDENVNHYEGEDSDEFEEEFQVSSPEGSSKNAMTNGNMRQIMSYDNPPPPKRRRNVYKSEDKRHLQRTLQQSADKLDGHEMFGRYVASRLRTMDPSMQTLSERLISEVLFRGQMGLLGRNTCISDDDLPIHPIKIEE
ncbi:uncharacterized protein [Parasteatoda tepidariorum]|uniref:uncharacterized protein n=1 Tax=Parasteatoda tepidariorum TaxID=114398 RepID=UPI00077FA8BE|nr:uncharacterized protein LOC107453394 [Parasteatoda tepidariorum]